MPLHAECRRSIGVGILLLVCIIALPIIASQATARSDGPPIARTGAPGEGDCSQCHGALNDGLGGMITIDDVPAAYVPGQLYTLSVTLSRTGKSRWGFEITALDAGDAPAGALAASSPLTGYNTQGGTNRQYVYQTTNNGDGSFAGTANGPVSWTFDWTAPAAGAGAVTFYAAGVAADGNGNADSGDPVYTTSVTSAEDVTTPTAVTTWGWIKNHYR